MFKSKYSTFLTIVLIILILSLIVIGVIFAIRAYKDYNDENEREAIYAKLKEGDIQNNGNDQNNTNIEFSVPLIDVNTITTQNNNTTNNSTGTGTSRRQEYYHNFPMVGYIKISKTNVSYPILIENSPAALETAVVASYPTNPKLNQPGVVEIIGHNYRNNRFFANNKKLVVGDKIDITDTEGKTLTYTIYEIFETSEADTSYLRRDRGNNIEIVLSTCTDINDGKRLKILARVEQ